jgi:hypothetical protein
MFAAKDRPPHDATGSSRSVTLAASLLTTSSEFHPADRTPVLSRPNPGVGGTCSPRKSNTMNTYANRAANTNGMRTYKIIGLKVSCNEHLQKNGGRGGLIVTQRPPTTRSRGQVDCPESRSRRPLRQFGQGTAEPSRAVASATADTAVTLRGSLSLTLAGNGVIPLRGSKLTIEEIQCVDPVL